MKVLKHQSGPPVNIEIKGKIIGHDTFTFIAGPCTIENYDDLLKIASNLKQKGIHFFRGGAYKMRTSPYNFQGLGKKGLDYIKQVADKTGLISVSEIISAEDVEHMSKKVDILQVGTRNMHNYRLLWKLGKIKNPIILKRGMSSTIEEWLLAAEHIIEAGNPNVILCERGIRTFENYTRHTLDISAIPVVKSNSNLPIIVDPSHSSGKREMIKSLSWAAMAAGADGLLIETHFDPDSAICDSEQTIDFDILAKIMEKKNQLLDLWGKK
jgi:3-deoxy-7-phosphoheptulonate synthase